MGQTGLEKKKGKKKGRKEERGRKGKRDGKKENKIDKNKIKVEKVFKVIVF